MTPSTEPFVDANGRERGKEGRTERGKSSRENREGEGGKVGRGMMKYIEEIPDKGRMGDERMKGKEGKGR